MPQPSTSDNKSTVQQPFEQNGQAERAECFDQPSCKQPAIVHPNFDPNQIPLDPARPLYDIPEPVPLKSGQLRGLYTESVSKKSKSKPLSKWQLIASKPFHEHLSLLSAAKLISLPANFYRSNSLQNEEGLPDNQALLSPLVDMTLLDMTDIQKAITSYPNLTRFGTSGDNDQSKTYQYCADELLNSIYADDWQVILQPQDFEMGEGNLATDIMTCSVAVHALKQCITRKTINKSYSAEQICHYVRSYLLSQVYQTPDSYFHYRQIRLFAGHIIVAAHYLGWDIHIDTDGQAYFNVSSRCGLLTRYANMQDYYVNGWGE